jgi:hypothetical protein
MDLEVQRKVEELSRLLGVPEEKVIEMAVGLLYSTVKPQGDYEKYENIKKLQYFKERSILTKKLAVELSKTLLEGGKSETLKLLRLKAEKKRFNVKDDKLISEFVEFMQDLIVSTEPSLIVKSLSEVFIDLRDVLPHHLSGRGKKVLARIR